MSADAGAERAAPVIAIDGPSASGKGTVARRVADALGFHYLDSGALYRLVALAALRRGLDPADPGGVAELASRLPAHFDGDRIFLEDEEVTDAIRDEAVSAAASRVAAHPAVRTALLARQRAYRRPPGLVADGRDMGSQVFPDAALKVFLTASPEERARRRYKQLIDKGLGANMRDLVRDIAERDQRDRERSVAPLRRADGARPIDTTALSIEDVVDAVLTLYRASAT
jgi:cytidylate kinase